MSHALYGPREKEWTKPGTNASLIIPLVVCMFVCPHLDSKFLNLTLHKADIVLGSDISTNSTAETDLGKCHLFQP